MKTEHNPIGTRYGRWLTLSKPYKFEGSSVVDLQCTCGSGKLATKKLAILKFRGGGCGCIRAEKLAERNESKGVKFGPGELIGRLTVREDRGCKSVDCTCSCGKSVTVCRASLKSGVTKSCGCLRSEMMSVQSSSHGKSKSAVYRVWRSMLERCNNPKCKGYRLYGARGIRVHADWLTFEGFYRDVGEPPFKGASLDRRNNDVGYSKDNCRWATRAEQAANTRRNRWHSFHGRLFMLKDLADLSNTDTGYLYYRINNMKDSAENAVKAKFPKTDWAAVVKSLPEDKYLNPQGN